MKNIKPSKTNAGSWSKNMRAIPHCLLYLLPKSNNVILHNIGNIEIRILILTRYFT